MNNVFLHISSCCMLSQYIISRILNPLKHGLNLVTKTFGTAFLMFFFFCLLRRPILFAEIVSCTIGSISVVFSIP